MHRLCQAAVLVAAFLSLHSPPAAAQNYPTRPIRVIASSSAGGLSDIFMRVLGDELHKSLGQPVIVENRPGGAFNIGARACADAAPDGYTVCIIPNEALVYNKYLFKNLAFDPASAFTPITNLFFITQVLVVNASLKAKTMSDLVALSKAKPGTLSYATASIAFGVLFERIKRETGADWVRVPFRGGGDAVNALLSGSTPIGFYGIGNVIPHLQSGLATGILVDATQRTPLFPEIPTLPEIGQAANPSRAYFALVGPAGIPKPIVDRLRAEIARIAAPVAFRDRHLVQRGLEPIFDTPEEFARHLAHERPIAEQLIKESGLQPQ